MASGSTSPSPTLAVPVARPSRSTRASRMSWNTVGSSTTVNSFLKGADGKWHPSPTTYDIGDEVKAWSAQLNTSTGSDYWKIEGGTRKPSLLRQFANAKTDDERAGVLARTSGYRNRNP